jgi:hypothetical protein
MLRCVLAFAAAFLLALPATAQVQRNFPQTALRGAIVVGTAPEISVNGQLARLAPAARIRDGNNMAVMPSALYGGKFLVHYTVDNSGLVKDVWILTPEEAARKPWPTRPEEAEAWGFDPIAQVWVKP